MCLSKTFFTDNALEYVENERPYFADADWSNGLWPRAYVDCFCINYESLIHLAHQNLEYSITPDERDEFCDIILAFGD